ncbi:DUF1080 domain-containing protein [Agriterribacter sp.]|uniref:3-keto-disaccharide hydrolase n=1 Tax=Agriterribacter sp. TaxID=2821509 RepID=UPI002BD9BD9A|nr:DUF1080 domain-containing protein [Agriterribacter sp.]HRP57890.1 DUF1080 domain-containing protein [Agriterribacter sp.]
MVKRRMYLLFLGVLFVCIAYAQEQPGFTTISLNDLEAFADPGGNWSVASDAVADINKDGELKPVPGTGALVNTVSKKNRMHLVTKENFGDVELELDFMMAKGSNSGIYLQGRYEIQLFDSWMVQRPSYSDCGGVYQRWNNDKNTGFEGYAPLENVARAPGLWQHLRIQFRAPRFNDQGVKTANARFEAVYLNGVLVQQQVALTGPTRSPLFEKEQATGPLMIQGDHGNVAIRNIQYRSLTTANDTPEKVKIVNPIIVQPEARPYLLRSFLSYGKKMITHAISVGDPNGVNYSYDLKTGALLQVWRGEFADATDLWHERGEPYQRIVPLGSVISLSDAPALAVLPDAVNTAWPDSVSFDDVQNRGYTLDAGRAPSFRYSIHDVQVTDKISVPDASGLVRALTVANPPANFYYRIAAAKKIEQSKKGFYAIDDKSYDISIDEKLRPFIRQAGANQELLVPVNKAGAVITYSLIW